MASSFILGLDTTAPGGVSIVLNNNAAFASSRDVTATVATTDSPVTGYQMKLWGDVDGSFNPSIQSTEAGSTWITFSTSTALRLSTGDGNKTVFVKVRDDVYNESAAFSDSIALDTTAPVLTITGPDVSRISKVATKNVSSFSFATDSALVAYKVKVVPSTNSLHDAGVQIGTTAGSTNMSGGTVSANATVSATINGTDLETASGGDGPKIIKVFGQDAAGNWSI